MKKQQNIFSKEKKIIWTHPQVTEKSLLSSLRIAIAEQCAIHSNNTKLTTNENFTEFTILHILNNVFTTNLIESIFNTFLSDVIWFVNLCVKDFKNYWKNGLSDYYCDSISSQIVMSLWKCKFSFFKKRKFEYLSFGRSARSVIIPCSKALSRLHEEQNSVAVFMGEKTNLSGKQQDVNHNVKHSFIQLFIFLSKFHMPYMVITTTTSMTHWLRFEKNQIFLWINNIKSTIV